MGPADRSTAAERGLCIRDQSEIVIHRVFIIPSRVSLAYDEAVVES